MVDWRYHIASLVSVFLALGIGMLVGVTFLDPGVFWQEQGQVVEQLESDFTRLRQENAEIQKELAATRDQLSVYTAFTRETIPLAAGAELSGRQIMVVNAASDYDIQPLVGLLEESGANLCAILKLKEPQPEPEIEGESAGQTLLGKVLAEELLSTGSEPGQKLRELEQKGTLVIERYHDVLPQQVLLILPNEPRTDPFWDRLVRPFYDSFTGAGLAPILVFAGNPEPGLVSEIEEVWGAGVIGEIEQPAGQFNLLKEIAAVEEEEETPVP